MSENDHMVRAFLSETIGRKEVNLLRDILLEDTEQFESVFQMIFEQDEKIAWHAAWVVEKVSEANPLLFSDVHKQSLIQFVLTNEHQGLLRLCLSILLNLPVYQPVSVEFVNACFNRMLFPRESVAVQVLSMKILGEICRIEADFIPELIACLENVEESLYTSGYLAAKRTVLKSLVYNKKKL